MKKAWTDIKSFITVAIILLFAYCIIRQIAIPEELKMITTTVVSFFLGSQAEKLKRSDDDNGNDNNE